MSPKYESSSWDSRPTQETLETTETPTHNHIASPTFSLMLQIPLPKLVIHLCFSSYPFCGSKRGTQIRKGNSL